MPTQKRQRKREGRQARAAALAAARKREQQKRTAIRAGIVALLVLAIAGLVYVVQGRGGGKSSVAATNTTVPGPTSVPAGKVITGDTPCPKADGSSERTTKFAQAPPMCIDVATKYAATVTTDVGVVTMQLDPTKAPKTVNNFVVLARYHFYDGQIFHRVIPDFVDQGGDPQSSGSGGPGYQFGDELSQLQDYKEGSLAMANSGPNSNGSQFFIVVSAQGAQSLVQSAGGQAKYSLFGQVTGGLDVAKKINADGTAEGSPKVVHTMTKIEITES